METRKFFTTGIALFLIACFSFMGCQKEVDDLQPLPEDASAASVLKTPATGVILSGTVKGTYRTGLILNISNVLTLKINVLTVGTYSINSMTTNGYAFTKSGTFTYKGIQDVNILANGTPIATGVNSFGLAFNNGFRFKVVVVNNTPIVQSSCNTSYTYYQVANHTTLRVWLDRNLGASRVAESATDFLGYGSLYQWGRLSDNHQCIGWSNAYTGVGLNGTTSTTSSVNVPGHSMFITTGSGTFDWRVPQNNSLWQGVSGINNPCPTGYRVPTSSELETEFFSWNSQNIAGGYGSSLKWAVSGWREYWDGEVYDAGSVGAVWSSTVSGVKANLLWISEPDGYPGITDDSRAAGYSVRCIKE